MNKSLISFKELTSAALQGQLPHAYFDLHEDILHKFSQVTYIY